MTGVDIGAADDEYTLFLLKNTASKIHAFEPDSIMVTRLNSNLRLNDGLELKHLQMSTELVGRSRLGRCTH